MKPDRPLLLLCFTTCLLRSPVILGDDDFITVNAATNDAAATQLSVTSDSQNNLQLAKVDDAHFIKSHTPQTAKHKAPSITYKTAAKDFTDEEIEEQRQLFLQAEKYIKKNKDAKYFLLADQLKDYPLYPYLQYQWLKKHLNQERQVKQFLEQHSSSRYAKPLKRKWLHRLAKNKQWQTFLQFYSETSDTSLNCYFHQAQYNTGDKETALNGAKELWAVGKSQPKVCDPLFAQLKKSSHFNQDLFWQRFDASLKNNKIKLASYITKLMAPADQKTAKLWLKLHRDPASHIPALLTQTETKQTPLMFSHAINRLARKDLNQAIDLWDQYKHNFTFDKENSNKLEKQLAFKLAYKNETGAYERLSQLRDYDDNSTARRIRLALNEQNWPRVVTAIQALSSEEQAIEKWQYWLARAYQETSKPVQADELFRTLSTKRSFYGYLAADKVNSLYQLSDNPIDVSAQQIADIKNQKEFRVAFEFKALERENNAKSQWWHAIRPLNKDEIIVAAKLAQQWQWDEVAIFTIAKVKYWDDIEVRFPLSFSDKIHENALLQNLNPVILFGLIRRESAFNENARSPVGARGLMQIMPRTGKQIAKDLNERWSGSNSLFNPVQNLKYGSYYYQKLLNQFDGHYALALAAYNAGPHRVKKWLPDETVPADIWIETIPFHETRDYVTSVLEYVLIYQQRTQSDELTMNDLTQDVQPLDSVSAANSAAN